MIAQARITAIGTNRGNGRDIKLTQALADQQIPTLCKMMVPMAHL
jgi:hypothetical protein